MTDSPHSPDTSGLTRLGSSRSCRSRKEDHLELPCSPRRLCCRSSHGCTRSPAHTWPPWHESPWLVRSLPTQPWPKRQRSSGENKRDSSSRQRSRRRSSPHPFMSSRRGACRTNTVGRIGELMKVLQACYRVHRTNLRVFRGRSSLLKRLLGSDGVEEGIDGPALTRRSGKRSQTGRGVPTLTMPVSREGPISKKGLSCSNSPPMLAVQPRRPGP